METEVQFRLQLKAKPSQLAIAACPFLRRVFVNGQDNYVLVVHSPSSKPLVSSPTSLYSTPCSSSTQTILTIHYDLEKYEYLSLFLKEKVRAPKTRFMDSKDQINFQDYLPLMVEKLGGDGLIAELCNGFQLLMDSDKGVITLESLRKNAASLGLQDMTDDDLHGMLKEGDFDGDGALNQMDFCILMFRLSPELMEQSQFLLEEALLHEGIGSFYDM